MTEIGKAKVNVQAYSAKVVTATGRSTVQRRVEGQVSCALRLPIIVLRAIAPTLMCGDKAPGGEQSLDPPGAKLLAWF